MSPEQPPLEIWGGPECSLNRVGDVFRDQIGLTGHDDREGDLDRFASLGLKTLRYPLLWERTEIAPGKFDWSWADRRLHRIRELGLGVVVGLVHHGSGPAWTDLLDPGFAEGLARFAGEAARRYPWIRDWTPVNEPLTTARFSALYGLWHPHRRDEPSFWLALLNQIDAVRGAMRAIRRIIPDARLIQTEDFGRTFATPPCQDQADHENRRRLMTWDLLCGRVTPQHGLYAHLSHMGFGPRLDGLSVDPCHPVIGLNHYVTSDRFLDHRLELYPSRLHGGNGRIAYADVEAVRALDPAPAGWREHLDTLWRRYQRPLIVTECHLGCTREEQLRWLHECWSAALDARRAGARVEAVTAWSLLGSFDWDSLLTRADGRYETGVFDLSEGSPRPTALAALVRHLALDGATDMALAAQSGWWRQTQRLLYPPGDLQRASGCAADPAAAQVILSPDLHPELVLECERRGLRLMAEADDEGQAWRFTASETPTARALDLLIDRRLYGEPVPETRHRDTADARRISSRFP
ncbi:hypothetical protein [Brevundimonas sp.]|uniref:hypothetical protein n=1 Tax=Brevundimonas sp. TaxID=1871086 RepID=UPI0028AB88D9|nr:hypothetical protein [Brevundimonas sp.]